MKTNKNLQSFEKLVGICTGLGDNYKPGQQKLQVEAMTTLLSQAQTLVSGMIEARTAHENASKHRATVFKELRQFSVRLSGALIASGASAETVAIAKAEVRKIFGTAAMDRAPVSSEATSATAAPTVKKRKSHGMDYGSLPSHFEKMVDAVAAEPNYHPNEAEFQLDALRAKVASLKASNSSVIWTAEKLRQAKNDCRAALYQNTNSICQVGQMAKQYVKSVYGFKNDNHLSMRKLPFTKTL